LYWAASIDPRSRSAAFHKVACKAACMPQAYY
jgi:hypothetical protein